MDKLRAFFKVVWQQRFWVLSVVVVIIAAICWQMASSALDAEFVTNKQTIEGKFGEMNKIASVTVHGNDNVNAAERKQAIVIRDEVLKLWQTMYERQKEEVLKWPEALLDDFLTEVEGKKFRDPISRDMRQRYREYAKEQFPKLVEMVQAKKLPDGDAQMGAFDGGRGGGGRGGGAFDMGGITADDQMPVVDEFGNEIEQDPYIVQWADQAALRQQLNFSQLPTSLQVWVMQEDLWVYETLLNAINDTNVARDSSRPDNAAIRYILALEVGQNAALASKQRGNVMLPPGAGAADAAGVDGLSADGGRGGYGTDVAGTALSPDAALMTSRYIGPDGAVIADASTDPGGECRRLPVRLNLYMDQQALPELLAQCANAALPVEVQRVRINPELSKADALAVASADAATDGGRGYDGGRGGGGGTFGGRDGGMGGGVPSGATAPGMATVEVLGIVYIYNPPDPTTLSVPGGDLAEVAAAEPGGAAM